MLKPLAIVLIGLWTAAPPAWAQDDQDFDDENEELTDESASSDDADADEDDLAGAAESSDEEDLVEQDFVDAAENSVNPDGPEASAPPLATPPDLKDMPPLKKIENEDAF